MRAVRGWRAGLGRGLSLRARLLIGLIALTAAFLVVMGVVSTLVLNTLEQNDLNSSLTLAVQQSVSQVATGPDGFAAAYLSVRTGAYGQLTPDSATGEELSQYLGTVAAQPYGQAKASLLSLGASEQPGNLPLAGSPALRAVWREVFVKTKAEGLVKSAGIDLPLGRNIILVGQSPGDIGSHVRALVLAELITGSALLAILVVCGNWLIGRGLAPLDGMASKAGQITSSGDLAARMPDPGDHRETGRLAGAINTMLDRIQQAFGALQQSEQKVRQFAADASHELRTPLTTIRGYAEALPAGGTGPGRVPERHAPDRARS